MGSVTTDRTEREGCFLPFEQEDGDQSELNKFKFAEVCKGNFVGEIK